MCKSLFASSKRMQVLLYEAAVAPIEKVNPLPSNISQRSCGGISVTGSLAFHICVSNQGSDFGWCRGGVNGVFSFQKVVVALQNIKILYCPAMANEKHFMHNAPSLFRTGHPSPTIWTIISQVFLNFHRELSHPCSVHRTDETPKITEQTKKHILPVIFAMMGSFNGKRGNLYASNSNSGACQTV